MHGAQCHSEHRRGRIGHRAGLIGASGRGHVVVGECVPAAAGRGRVNDPRVMISDRVGVVIGGFSPSGWLAPISSVLRLKAAARRGRTASIPALIPAGLNGPRRHPRLLQLKMPVAEGLREGPGPGERQQAARHLTGHRAE